MENIPQTQAEVQGGMLPEVGKQAFIYGGERSAISARTLLHGPTRSNKFLAQFFGLHQTPEEITRWTAGQSAMPGLGGRKTIGTQILGAERLGKNIYGESRGVLGTMYTPSSWITSARIAANGPEGYGSWALQAARGMPAEKWQEVVRETVTPRKAPMSMVGPGAPAKGAAPRELKSLEGYKSVWKNMTNAEASEAINRMMKFGEYGGKFAPNLARDIGTGLWYRAPAESGLSVLRYNQWSQSAYKPVKWLGDIAGRGAARRFAGVTASEIGTQAATVTGFAKGASAASMGLGVASRMFGYAYMGAQVGKLAWKTGELVMYKVPKATFSTVARQISRPVFSGGDSALLTGIPANNRMRAVQAIQGSRLNARNALGSEASMMAGYFG